LRSHPGLKQSQFQSVPQNSINWHSDQSLGHCFLSVLKSASPLYPETTGLKSSGTIYSDLTGRSPRPSSQGNHHLFVSYDYDSNHIFGEPLKNRFDNEILRAFMNIKQSLTNAGLRPRPHCLGNEAAKTLKGHMAKEGIDFQLAPAHSHRINAAERCIRTSKDHTIAGLCSLDKDSPVHLWDRLIPQAFVTLNLLRGPRMGPSLSAYAQIFGPYDYNRHPMAPPMLHFIHQCVPPTVPAVCVRVY